MKKIVILLFLAIIPFCIRAQVTGTVTVPGTYPDLATAITDLNTVGISGNVIVNITAPQSAPAGGYLLGSAVLNASTSSAATMVINGGNNLITPNTGTGTVADAVFRVAGTDYVTLNQLNIVENPANITTTTQMERGIWLCLFDATDACKNVTVQNCSVNLNGTTVSAVEAGILVNSDIFSSTGALATQVTVSVAGGIPSDITIKSNTLTNCYNGIYVRANSTLANYLTNLTIGGNTLSDGNIITNFGIGATTTSNGIFMIYTNNDICSYNTLSTILSGSSNICYGIYSQACSGTRVVNNNDAQLVNSVVANSSAMYPIYNNAGVSTLQMNNNNIHDCSTVGTGLIYALYNSSSTSGLAQMNNNIVTNYTRTGSGGTFWGIYSSMAGAGTREINNNSISNINYTTSSTTTSSLFCLYPTSSQTATCNNNTISGVTIGGTSTGAITVYGIYNLMTTSTAHLLQGNTITNISCSSPASTLYGMFNSNAAGTNTIARNNINNISATSATSALVRGMSNLGAGSRVVRNNFISRLTAPTAVADNAVLGMEATGGTNDILNNTIHLGSLATLTGLTNFGATGFAWTSAAISVNLQNNIINVKATPSGTGVVAAMRDLIVGVIGTVPTNLATTNNNNILHAPAGTRSHLYTEGILNQATLVNAYNLTNDPNFNLSCGSTFKAFMAGRNSASATENNLVAGPGINTFIPSGSSRAQNTALVLPLVTVDFAGTTRSMTPDMGALEFTGPAGPDAAPPVITYTNIPTKVCLANPILTATITDLSGVDVSPTNAPRIYYKKTSAANAFAGNTSADNGWKWVATTSTSNPYSFTMDYSLLQSVVVPGDTIQYFVVAQDLATTPNIGANTAFYNTGFCPSSVDLTVPAGATPITGVKSFTIIPVPSSLTATPAFDTLCISGSVNLAAGAASTITDPALVWQWQSSPIGANTWSNISGANTSSYTVALQSSSTDYQLTATCPSPQGFVGASTTSSIYNNIPILTSTTADTICGTNTATLQATTITPYQIGWYANPAGGIQLGTGTTFVTPVISTTDTFYASAYSGGSIFVGPATLTTLGTSNGTSLGSMQFDVTAPGPINVKNIDLYALTGAFNIEVRQGATFNGGTLIDFYTGTATVGGNNVQTFPVDLQIPPGTSYWISLAAANPSPSLTVGASSNPISSNRRAGVTGFPFVYPNITFTNTNAGTIYWYHIYNWELSNTCDGPRVPVIARVTPAPTIMASNDTTVCWDGSVSVPMSVTSGNAGYTYSWAPALGLNTTSGASVLANPLSPTQYIVTGNDITSGCQTTDSVLVAVSSQFYDTASASLSAICAGGSVNIIAGDSVPPLPPYCVSGATLGADTKIDTMSFAGIITGSSPSTQELYTDYTSVVIPASAGVALPLNVRNGSSTNNHYAAYLKVWIDYNQSGTFDASELVYSFGSTTALNTIPSTTVTIPTSAFNGPTRMRLVLQESGSASTAACGTWDYGETEDYTINISGATPKPVVPYTYSWMPGSLSGASQTVSPTATTTYVATQMNAFGCKAQDSVTVTVNQPMIAATPATQTICVGGTTPVMITATGATSYTWTPTTGLTFNATNDTALALPSTTTTYSVSGTDVNGCVGTAMATVVLEALPVKDSVTAMPSAVCTNGTAMLNAHFIYPKAAAAYCSSNATNSADTKIDTVKFAGVITGSSPTNPETYTNNTSVVIPAAAGVPLPLQIINGSESLTHYGARVKVWIDYNQDNVFDANEMVYEFGQTTALNTIPATTITIPTTALNGPTRMRVVFRESGTTTSTVACGTYTYGETEDYTVNISGATPPITYSYAWTPIASVVSPTSAATSTNPIANTTTFAVTATSSGAGCSATDSVTVTVTPLSAAQTTASKQTLCAGDSSQLGVTSTGGGLPYSYSWSPTSGMASGAGTTQNPWVTPATTTTYTVTVTDACTTTRTSVVTITVNPLPTLTASASDSTLCFGDSSILTAVGIGSTFPTTVTLAPSKDNTIYEENQNNSNGAGPNIVAGQNGFGAGFKGRALLAFDLSSIPVGAVITSASLQLNCSQNPNTTPQPFMLHKASANWGEGTSSATGAGAGAAATINDATWLNAFTPAPAWGTPGGVFAATASATQTVVGTGFYTWTGAGMVADIQSWLAAPNTNNGWLLKGQETAASQARRFDSRENPTIANRPALTVTYTLPATSYTWMPSSLNGATQTVVPSTNTSYSVTFVDSATGCTNMATLPITVVPPSYVTAAASATAICVGDSVNLVAADSVPNITYCPASATCDEAVNNVVFNTISNATGCSGGYSDQTSISTTVAAGTTYPIAVTTTTFYTSDQCTAWLDWNQDGDFTDADEAFILSGGPTFSGSIAVPLTALNGSTRMRIRMTYTGVNAPCGTQSWGETEDYTVNITGGVASPAPVYTYAWMPGSLVGATQTVSPTSNTTYTVTQTDSASGCQVKDSVSISINASPVLAVSASPNDTVCAGTIVTLMSGAAGATSYAWNGVITSGMDTVLSPAVAGTYTVVATSANGCSATDSIAIVVNNPVITSLTATPAAVCIGGNTVLSVLPGITGAPTPYCNSAFTNVVYEFITNVTLGSINNTSVGNIGGPVNYTSQVANLSAGIPSTLSVTIDPDALDYVYAWIDWNQNGILNDAGELYTLATSTSAPGPHTLSITPPLTALNGPTRMRVMVDYNNAIPNPCRSATWGEAEDYTVNVSGGVTPSSGFASIVWSPTTYLGTSTTATVNATGVLSNTTYTVQGTDAFGCTVTSSISLTATPAPTGNTFANPKIVTSLPYADTANNMSSNCWTDAGTFTGNRASNDVFYRFTLNGCTDSIVASLCGSATWDTYMYLLDNGGSVVTSDDDGCPSSTQSVIRYGGLTQGGTYYIVVEGYGATDMGTYTLNLNAYEPVVAAMLAPTTTNQTLNQSDGSSLNYNDVNCNRIATINDGAGGNILGSTSASITVDPTASFHNGQPYARRWYQITPTSNGTAEVILYFNQSDFNDLNAATIVPYVMVPTTGSNTDPNIANIRITKNDNAGLGSNPVVLTPTSVNWNGNYWEVRVNTPNFSQFRLHGANPNNAPLNVLYTSFTVTKEATSDLVAWTTSSENNNSHFNVQRSADGVNFETLERVNTQAPNGNSATKLSYNYTDTSPMIGHNYYRLEQVDLDNKTNYTKTIDIIWGAQGSVVSIYPNPTRDILNIDLSTGKVSQTEIKLLDMSGRVVKSVIAQTQKGLNNITLDLSDIASGVYGIQIFENNKLTHNSKVNKKD